MASLAYCHGKCGKRWEREPGEGLYCSPECEQRALEEMAANEAELRCLGFCPGRLAVNVFVLDGLSLTVEEAYREGLDVALAKVGFGRNQDGRFFRGASGGSSE